MKISDMKNGEYGMLIDDPLLYGRVIKKQNNSFLLLNPDRVPDQFTNTLKRVELIDLHLTWPMIENFIEKEKVDCVSEEYITAFALLWLCWSRRKG
jgi:hypothetical protein